MIIYNNTKSGFVNEVMTGTIADSINRQIFEKMHRKVSKNEFKSWENSMPRMCLVLNSNDIPDDCGVAIEYNVPQTSKRVDFIVSGYDKNDNSNAVVVELKQWSSLDAVENSDSEVMTYVGGANRTVVHPSYQAWSYVSLIREYNQNVQQDNISLHPCAYLHNYRAKDQDPIYNRQYKDYLDEAPVFTSTDTLKLQQYIKSIIKKGDNREIIYRIEDGRIRPSKSLQNTISSMLKGNQEFVMIDDQRVAYNSILNTARIALKNTQKHTIIVEGGPGTGKSVIAINLLSQLTIDGQFVQYVSKNSAPRTVYQTKLKGDIKKSVVNVMFSGSGIYTETDNNFVDTILVDEAHRLNAKSGMYQNKGENQVKEIIHSSKCSVFFIDESQRVTMSDIGSVAEIEKWAKYEGSSVTKLKLESQFRCNGSDGYLAWIDDILEIRESANFNLYGIDYDFKVFDNPEELREEIFRKNEQNNRSRLLAGYCWKWIKDAKNNPNVYDIEIGNDFKMSWNLGNSIFAIDDTSINQVGCIHTCQGLEFDYVGVIIGEDLRLEDGKLITDFTKRASTDQSIKGLKSLYKKDPDEANRRAEEIIKNTYRTLMTRGMKGCYVYCTDERLSEYLKQRI